MIVFKDTITIYNVIPQLGREPERLQRTVIRRAFWDGAWGKGYGKAGAEPQDSIVVIIPYISAYMHPARWADAGYPAANFTLQAGDVVVRGEVADENLTAAELLKKYGAESCFVATGINNCCYGTRSLWNWEVHGK